MSNPMLSEDRWSEIERADGAVAGGMTIEGTITKTGILLAILLVTLGVMWSQFWAGHTAFAPQTVYPYMIGGFVGGLICVLVGMFAPRTAVVCAPVYAVCKGLALGGLTMLMESRYPGIPLLAVVFTVGVFATMLVLYRARILRATPAFTKGVIAATAGLVIGVLALWILNMFGIGMGVAGALYGNGWIGIGFSVLCIGLAAFNLIVDFGFIEGGAQGRLPKYMEWVGAFGLLITLVWLYVEILRLLAKLRRE